MLFPLFMSISYSRKEVSEVKDQSSIESQVKENKKTTKKPYVEPSYEKKSSLYKDTGQVIYYYYRLF